MLFFQFPEDARWNSRDEAVEFSVVLGPYEGTVRVPKQSFRGLLDQSPTPQHCLEAFHLQRTRFEMIVERKLRRRQLADDGNIEITGRDLREREPDRPRCSNADSRPDAYATVSHPLQLERTLADR